MSTLRKKTFSAVPGNFFSLGLKLLRFSFFRECGSGIDEKPQFENDIFFKSFFTMNSFGRYLISMKKYWVR